MREFPARQAPSGRRNRRYSVSQMLLPLLYPIVLGLDRIETASFLRSNGSCPYRTGWPSFPDPQTLRRLLWSAPARVWQQLPRANDRPLPRSIHLPQRSYNPPLCLEANSCFLWDVALRPEYASTWEGGPALPETSFAIVPPEIRELRVRADAGFGYHPVLETLETHRADCAVVGGWTAPLERLLPGLRYQPANARWVGAQGEFRAHGRRQGRRIVVPRRLIKQDDVQPTLFPIGRCLYRVWITNLALTPAGVAHFYDGRAAMEPRIRQLREDFALRKIPRPLWTPTRSTWRGSAWPTTWRPPSSPPACILAKLDAPAAALQSLPPPGGTDPSAESPHLTPERPSANPALG